MTFRTNVFSLWVVILFSSILTFRACAETIETLNVARTVPIVLRPTTIQTEQDLRKYDEVEYLKRKCEFFQNFRVKDRESFLAWIHKQWGQDQFDLDTEFRTLTHDQLYLRLLERFNVTHRQIFENCKNIYYPLMNDTRERTHREQFRGIYLLQREYLFKMDHWLRWTVDNMPYYIKKVQRDKLSTRITSDGLIDLECIENQLEYERRIDEQVHECKKMIQQMLYRHGNTTIEEFAYEVTISEKDFKPFDATEREHFIKHCNMFRNLQLKHYEFLKHKRKGFWFPRKEQPDVITRVDYS